MRIENAEFYFHRWSTTELNYVRMYNQEQINGAGWGDVPYYYPEAFSATVILNDQRKQTTFTHTGAGDYNLIYSFSVVENGVENKKVLRVSYRSMIETQASPLWSVMRSHRVMNEPSLFQLPTFVVEMTTNDNKSISVLVTNYIEHDTSKEINKNEIKKTITDYFLETGRILFDGIVSGNIRKPLDGKCRLVDFDFGLRIYDFEISEEVKLGFSPDSRAIFSGFFTINSREFYNNPSWSEYRDVFNLMCALWMLQKLGLTANQIKSLELHSDAKLSLIQYLGNTFEFFTKRKDGVNIEIPIADRYLCVLDWQILSNYLEIHRLVEFFIPDEEQRFIDFQICIVEVFAKSSLSANIYSSETLDIGNVIDGVLRILILAEKKEMNIDMDMLDGVLKFASANYDWIKLGVVRNGLENYAVKSSTCTIDALFTDLQELKDSQQSQSAASSATSPESIDFSQSFFSGKRRDVEYDSSLSVSPVERSPAMSSSSSFEMLEIAT